MPGCSAFRFQIFQGKMSLTFSLSTSRLVMISSCGPELIAALSSISRTLALSMAWSSRITLAKPSPKMLVSSLSNEYMW
ncbi:hypothetical protein D3C86_2094680 [compost metagenome]